NRAAVAHTRRAVRRGGPACRPCRAKGSRRVVVVGAGPAGVQAARIAAERGHAVTLFGASREIGGKLRREAGLPGCEEFLHLIAWMERQVRRTDARPELGLRAPGAGGVAAAPAQGSLAARA